MAERWRLSAACAAKPDRAAVVRASRERTVRRALLVLIVAPAFSRCGGGPPPPLQAATPPPPDSTPQLTVPVDPSAALLAGEVNRARTALAQANALLDQGEHERAAAVYQEVSVMHLSDDPEAMHELQVDALWGVAIANLSITPNRAANNAASRTALQTIIAASDGTLQAATARWVLGQLDESDRLRAQGVQNQAEIRRLTETIDQLKRVDTRRPGPGGR
jgi:hypothetical protein